MLPRTKNFGMFIVVSIPVDSPLFIVPAYKRGFLSLIYRWKEDEEVKMVRI